jgi:acyl-ACP thioesterase
MLSREMDVLRETFTVRSYEVDPRRRLTLRALCAYLQEAAGLHAARLGVGMERLEESGLAWVLHRLKLELLDGPRLGDVLQVVTWPSRFDRVLADREFEVLAGDVRVAAASTRWAVADVRLRRPVRLPDFIQAVPVDERTAPIAIGRDELPAVARPAFSRTFPVRRADLDVVGHVNNTQYVSWLAETVPDEVDGGMRAAGLEVVFRQEARYGDVVVSEAEPLDGEGGATFAHALRREADGAELARAVTRWTR